MMNGYGGKNVITKQHRLQKNLLGTGIERARATRRPVLVSQVREIESCHPLSFFMAGQKKYHGQRLYWSAPGTDMTLIGLGNAYSIEVQQEADYAGVEHQWQDLLQRTMIDGACTESGTGPLLMGGFAFDPVQRRTSLWRHFPATMLVLPRYVITLKSGQAWLTTNRVVDECSETTDIHEEDINQREQKLLLEEARNVDQLMRREGDRRYFPHLVAPGPFTVKEIEPEQWKKLVQQVAGDIQTGDVEKVALAREVRLQFAQSPSIAYVLQQLHAEQTNSYVFALESEGHCFIGATPERLVKKNGRTVLSTCLAGSIDRGSTPDEDERLGKHLLGDPKNRYEHDVVVQMIRSAFQEACVHVQVPEEPVLYRAPHIQHLYTPVQGSIRPETSLLQLIGRLTPTPAVGGYPQQKALSYIRRLEKVDRGWYAAPLGWIDHHQDGEFIVGLRSGLVRGKKVSLFAGCGIMGDSEPNKEYEETNMKFKPMLSALGGKTT
jgi:menaquinone-specific isochorismate synthase